MQTGRASRTALRVAIRRAAHQLIDQPRVLDDPIAVRLIGPGFARDMERAMHPVARDFRLFMAARSRYAEDHLAAMVAQGVSQYVILGAGLTPSPIAIRFPLCGSSKWTFLQPSNGSESCWRKAPWPCPPT